MFFSFLDLPALELTVVISEYTSAQSWWLLTASTASFTWAITAPSDAHRDLPDHLVSHVVPMSHPSALPLTLWVCSSRGQWRSDERLLRERFCFKMCHNFCCIHISKSPAFQCDNLALWCPHHLSL